MVFPGTFLRVWNLLQISGWESVASISPPGSKHTVMRKYSDGWEVSFSESYACLLVAAALGIAAIRWDTSGGIWGASRHALTLGFISVMILSVGQRILPAFAGMRMHWSTKLMFVGLAFVTVGCTLRVSCEVIAYQGYAVWAWSVLPTSALCELAGLTVYAINILGTFILEPCHSQKHPVVVGVSGNIP